MEFKIEKRGHENKDKYQQSDIDIAYKFAKKAYKEFGSFVKAIAIFGGAAKSPTGYTDGDIDILIIVDDISFVLKGDIVETYRIIVQKLVAEISPRLHITTLKFTSFWEYIRAGDPVAINILRDGEVLIDTGFFEPLQVLLKRGRIRPTQESVWSYFVRAPATLQNSKWHLLQATLDLYWAVIDAAHAALMRVGEIPPNPKHAAELIDEKLVSRKKLQKKHVNTMRKFYNLSKMIIRREVRSISGKEYDAHYEEAREFVDAVKKFLEEKPKGNVQK